MFKNPYWKLSDRFVRSSKKGILYRPEIVDAISETIEALFQEKNVPLGLMIKGPQGSGKSHSILNVVRKLQLTEKYLVTYIPDCDDWTSSSDLINAICLSFGSRYYQLDLPYFKNGKDEYEDEFMDFINVVDTVLKQKGKQWVFVFDQTNRIFARHPDMKGIGSLPFPFYMIKNVMTAGRISTIISDRRAHV